MEQDSAVVRVKAAEALGFCVEEGGNKLDDAVRTGTEECERFEFVDGMHRISLLHIADLEREIIALNNDDQVASFQAYVARLEVVELGAKSDEGEASVKAEELSFLLDDAPNAGMELWGANAEVYCTSSERSQELRGLKSEVANFRVDRDRSPAKQVLLDSERRVVVAAGVVFKSVRRKLLASFDAFLTRTSDELTSVFREMGVAVH